MDKKHKFELPYCMGLDEVKIGKIFRTTVTNLQRHTLVELLEKRSGDSLREAFKRYSLPERSRVRWICTDMYRPFEKPLKDMFPAAEWVIDHFHVVRYGNDAMDTIRRAIQNQLIDKEQAKGLKKGLRYTLLTRQDQLTEEQAKKIEAASTVWPALIAAYGIKEDLYGIYNEGNRQDAERAFVDWEANIPADEIFEPFRRIAKMIHTFHEPIFNYWSSNNLTNGYTECANGLIRTIDRRARGMRFKMLRGMVLYNPNALQSGTIGPREYGASILDEELPTTNESEDNDNYDNNEFDADVLGIHDQDPEPDYDWDDDPDFEDATKPARLQLLKIANQ